jgi:hypothetical protein
MATNAAMERNIKNRASIAFNSLSEVDPEPEVEPEPEFEASDIRRKSELMEELTKTLGEKAAQIARWTDRVSKYNDLSFCGLLLSYQQLRYLLTSRRFTAQLPSVKRVKGLMSPESTVDVV